MYAIVVKAFSVTPTWPHVAGYIISIVETSTFLMETDCHSLDVVIFLSFVDLRE